MNLTSCAQCKQLRPTRWGGGRVWTLSPSQCRQGVGVATFGSRSGGSWGGEGGRVRVRVRGEMPGQIGTRVDIYGTPRVRHGMVDPPGVY